MKYVSAAVSVVAVVAALFHAGPQQALACSCAFSDRSEAERARALLENADMLVVARVDSISVPNQERNYISADVIVEQSFKGDAARRLNVSTSDGSASCGYEALLRAPQERHLLAIQSRNGRHSVNLCSSQTVNYGEEDEPFTLLYELNRIAPPREPPEQTNNDPQLASIAGFVAPSLIALTAIVLFSQGRRATRS